MTAQINSVFLPETKLVYRVDGTVVNSSRKIASITDEGQTNPLVFHLFDENRDLIATIYANEAVVTYE